MSVAVVYIDDGRYSYLTRAIQSVKDNFDPSVLDCEILIDDSGEAGYADRLLHEFFRIDKQVHHETRRGLAAAMRSAWESALEFNPDYVLHWEGDFVANEVIPVAEMTRILKANPKLAQVTLKRQPVNPEEEAAGGFIETNPSEYWQREGWIEHHLVFSFNPCLVPVSVVELCLANPGDGLERGFTDTLLQHGYSFGIFGQLDDKPRVDHIGTTRANGWKP